MRQFAGRKGVKIKKKAYKDLSGSDDNEINKTVHR